jgi:serine/threonine-protein kinase
MAQEIRPGQSIDGRYRLIRKVGEGGMGEVYEAEGIHNGKTVAIKILHGSRATDPTLDARLAREARATSRIDHPNVVRVEDFGRDPGGHLYMAMEWLDGATLDEHLEDGPMEPDRAIAITRQICAGLQAAHDIGLVHRDLKPANVFLVDHGQPGERVVLVDFGIAKLIGDDAHSALTEQGTFVGTPYYVAPEQALGEPIDSRADLYALGAMLYEMLTGRPPFEASSVMGVLQQHIEATPRPPSRGRSDQLPALDALVLRCMAKRPDDRFASVAEVSALLDQLESRPASASLAEEIGTVPRHVAEPNPGPSSSRSMVRAIGVSPARRVLALLIILGLLAGAAAAVWVFFGARGDDSPATEPVRTSWQVSDRTRAFELAATVTPNPSRPGQRLTVALHLGRVADELRAPLRAGQLRVAVAIRDARDNTLVVTERSIEPGGQIPRPIQAVPQAGGTYSAEVRLLQGGRELGKIRFALCVGADPLGDPGLLRRMCPGFRPLGPAR